MFPLRVGALKRFNGRSQQQQDWNGPVQKLAFRSTIYIYLYKYTQTPYYIEYHVYIYIYISTHVHYMLMGKLDCTSYLDHVSQKQLRCLVNRRTSLWNVPRFQRVFVFQLDVMPDLQCFRFSVAPGLLQLPSTLESSISLVSPSLL